MELFHAPLFFVYFCRRMGDATASETLHHPCTKAPPRPSPVGRGTRGETGTYRDASLKSLSVTARRDACHASGTKATVNYTLFKNKNRNERKNKEPVASLDIPEAENP